MQVEIMPPGPLRTIGVESEAMSLSSVAVWVIVKDNGLPVYYLAVEQGDIHGNPWGVPAGKVSDMDNSPYSAAIRELTEETGIQLDVDDLSFLTWSRKSAVSDSGYVIFGTSIDKDKLEVREEECLEDGTIIFSPPYGVDRSEVSRLALVPLTLAYKENILNNNPYRPRETYRGLAALRRKGLVSGRFGFETDPYLFDE